MLNEKTVRQLIDDVGAPTARRLVGIFAAETRQRMERMVALEREKDAQGLRHEAHALKSAALTYGADHLGALALDLEMACQKRNKEGKYDLGLVPGLVQNITTVAGAALEALESFVQRA